MSSSTLRNRIQSNPNTVTPIQSSSDTLREMNFRITEANEQAVESILHALEHDKHMRKSRKLFHLINDYFSNSFLMSELCNALEECLRSARNRQLILRTAVELFNEEEENTNGAQRYVRALEELKRFLKAENPFPLFSRVLDNVFLKQKALADKLNCCDEKNKYCLLHLKAWKRFSRIICLLVDFRIMILCVMARLAGQSQWAASFSSGSIEKRFKSNNDQTKRELELTSTMKECAFVELNDLKEICSTVDQLEKQLKTLLQNANFALGGQDAAVKLRFEEIERNMGRFTETLDELGQSARRCSQDLQKGSLVIKDKIRIH